MEKEISAELILSEARSKLWVGIDRSWHHSSPDVGIDEPALKLPTKRKRSNLIKLIFVLAN